MLDVGFKVFSLIKKYLNLIFNLIYQFFRYILSLSIIKNLLSLFEFTIHF